MKDSTKKRLIIAGLAAVSLSLIHIFPNSREVETQYLEGDMLAELGLKESRAFRKEIEKISKEVFGV